jgi:hypothetical protein
MLAYDKFATENKIQPESEFGSRDLRADVLRAG